MSEKDDLYFLINITIILEMRNAFKHCYIFDKDINELVKKENFVEWEIQDNIVYEYENLGSIVTKFKLKEYNLLKNKARDNYLHTRLETNSNLKTNIPLNILNYDLSRQLIENNEIDKKEINYDSDYFEKTDKNYKEYITKAINFLENYPFFKKSKYILDASSIHTSKNYYNYLDKFFRRILYSANKLINFRTDQNSPYNYNNYKNIYSEYKENVESKLYNSQNTHILESLIFVNKEIKEFILMIKQLYILSITIKDTTILMNKIINKYIIPSKLNTFWEEPSKSNKFWEEYTRIIHKHLNEQKKIIPLRLTNMFQYIQSYFVAYNNKNKIINPLSSLCIYINTCFEINEIFNKKLCFMNELLDDNYKVVNFMHMIYNLDFLEENQDEDKDEDKEKSSIMTTPLIKKLN